ncbi:hypothetical protein AHAS_Ahas05G0162100 [Arachis hypogaea]
MHIPPMRVPHKLLKELANSFKLGKNTLETSYGSFKVTPSTIGAALGLNASDGVLGANWCTKLLSPGMAPKLGARYHGLHDSSQLRTADQQVHWVVQVIPYVSKGRSHGDCRLEASYGHLVNLNQADSNSFSMKMVLDGFCTASQLSDFSSRMKNTRHSYRMANHLSILDRVRIRSNDLFASFTTPHSREFEARHSHPFPDPTRNTTDKV